MIVRQSRAVVALVVASASACSLFTDLTGLSSHPVGDAGDVGSDAGVSADGMSDADAASDCRRSVLPEQGGDFTSSIDPRWALRGKARVRGGSVELTDLNSGDEGGALWWDEVMSFDKIDISCSLTYVPGADGPTDGFALAFISGNEVPAMGGTGSGYGVNGIRGFAVAIDVFTDNFDPLYAPFLSVVNTLRPFAEWFLKSATVSVATGTPHTIRVLLDAPLISAWVDGALRIDRFTLPLETAPGHWGFTAATGSKATSFSVTNITATVPGDGGCAPFTKE